MKQIFPSQPAFFRNLRFLLRDVRREHRALLACLSVETLLGCVTPVVALFLPKIMIEYLTQPAVSSAQIGVIALLLLLSAVVSAVLSSIASTRYVYLGSLNMDYLKKLFYSALAQDYQTLESANGQTAYHRARRALVSGSDAGVSSMLSTMQAMLAGILCFALYSGVLASLNPAMIAILIALSVSQYAILKRAREFEGSQRGKLAEEEKKMFVLETIAANPSYGKDIRMYSLAGWIQTVWSGILGQYIATNRAVNGRYGIATVASTALVLLRDLAAYAYLITSVAGGRISVAYFSLYLGAVVGFSAFTGTFLQQFHELKRANLQVDDLRSFLESGPPPHPPASGAGQRFTSMELQDVTFSFAGQEQPLIDRVSLQIRRGERIALVGLNGAGKTTLIKLLCGFYRPQSGTVRINGQDANALDPAARLACFSAVFQDGTVFPFSIAENVSLLPEAETDLVRVADCLVKVGLGEVVARLENGVHSVLTRDVDADGVVLSYGQRQKLLMARAVYRDAPVWLLDEPTSFLDPPSEQNVHDLLRNAGSEKTIVFISHRIGSARFCERILLLENGAVTESGSHDALLRLNGTYARLYRAGSA